MKIPVSELNELQLDWAVAVCQNEDLEYYYPMKFRGAHFEGKFNYLGNPSLSVPIFNRHLVELTRGGSEGNIYWEAIAGFEGEPGHAIQQGPTLEIAGLRAYVASEKGIDIEVPDELV